MLFVASVLKHGGKAMLKTLLVTIFGSLSVFLSTPRTYAFHPTPAIPPQYDYATVDEVKALTRLVEVPASREECWEEPVTYSVPSRTGAYSYTPVIVGGIVGAVVGNQFGRGSGRDWATVAGGLLGASIGRDHYYSRHYSPTHTYAAYEERCRVVTEYQQEERLDGYLVNYTYNGRQYQTRTDKHPGTRIKIRLDATPEID